MFKKNSYKITYLTLISHAFFISIPGIIDNISVYLVILLMPFLITDFIYLISKGVNLNRLKILLVSMLIVTIVILSNYSTKNEVYRGIFWWIVFILLIVRPVPNLIQLRTLSIHILMIGLFVLFFDFIYRYFFNVGNLITGKYAFKSGLIMGDSNFSGVYACLLLSYVFYMERIYNESYFIIKILYTLFTILTLSLSAVIIILLIYLFNIKNNLIKYAIISTIFLASPFLIQILLSDQSASSKFEIIVGFIDYVRYADLESTLLGLGLDNGIVAGWAPHLLFIKIYVEIGVLGLICYIIYLITMLIAERKLAYVVVPYLLLGLSTVFFTSQTAMSLYALIIMHQLAIKNVVYIGNNELK